MRITVIQSLRGQKSEVLVIGILDGQKFERHPWWRLVPTAGWARPMLGVNRKAPTYVMNESPLGVFSGPPKY